MGPRSVTAVAHPNIALIKYWGNRDAALRIPANGSISLTLGGLQTRTTVAFDPELPQDRVTIDGETRPAPRVGGLLDVVRQLAGIDTSARVDSCSDFPVGAGLAASAASFAALSLAASAAAGLELSPEELSRLARRGSGSAARSIFGGYVELIAADNDAASHARQIAGPSHWELVDLVAIVRRAPKPVGSTPGHAAAESSPLQAARVADAPRRLDACRQAILDRDFARLAEVAEHDSDLMHAIMMTSRPPLHYWLGPTVEVMGVVRQLRTEGLSAFYTVDAGPNVHCLCLPGDEAALRSRLEQVPGVLDIRRGAPGQGARLAASEP